MCSTMYQRLCNSQFRIDKLIKKNCRTEHSQFPNFSTTRGRLRLYDLYSRFERDRERRTLRLCDLYSRFKRKGVTYVTSIQDLREREVETLVFKI